MQQSEEYMRRADEADANALLTIDPMVGKQFRQVAEQWRDLARQRRDLAIRRGGLS